MNMMDGWTEEECDNVIYAVKKEDFIFATNTFQLT